MIYLFVTARGSSIFRDYLDDWAGENRDMMEIRLYEDFLRWPDNGLGTYIFSDLERLTDEQIMLVSDFANKLEKDYPGVRILNHPERALRRLGLLNALHAAGINHFRAYPVTAMPPDARYPLFLRLEREHRGAASPPVNNAGERLTAALRLASVGVRMAEVLAVEYCETRSADGLYRKYSAFRFGERIIPAHIIFSEHWVAKDGATNTEQLIEENTYLETHPHAQWLEQVFKLAQIEYGRIDYSMLDGKPQIWEINTNPTLLKQRSEYEQHHPLELPTKEKLALTLRECFSLLESGPTPAPAPGRRNILLNKFARHIAHVQ